MVDHVKDDLLRISEAVILLIPEINESYLGRSIRTFGFACSQPMSTGEHLTFIEYNHQKLLVDIALIPPDYALIPGSLYRFIGELMTNSQVSSTYILRARLVTCVNGMDCSLFQKALQAFRSKHG